VKTILVRRLATTTYPFDWLSLDRQSRPACWDTTLIHFDVGSVFVAVGSYEDGASVKHQPRDDVLGLMWASIVVDET
jgi:hypothetical protein